MLEQRRQTEVDDLGLPVRGHQDVAGLQVAVQQSFAVGSRERLRHLLPQVRHLVGRERAAVQYPVQRFPLDILHDDEIEAALAAELMDLGDVGITERGSEPRLVEEHAPTVLVAGDIGRQHLDRDDSTEDHVLGLPHHTHSALADLLGESVVRNRLTCFDRHALSIRTRVEAVE